MSLSLLALFIIPLYLKLVLDPKGSYKHFKNMATDQTVQIHTAAGMLILAVIIFADTGFQFGWNWESLLPFMGLLLFIKSVLFLMPGYIKAALKPFKEKHMPIYGFMGLLAGLFFVFVDTQLLG